MKITGTFKEYREEINKIFARYARHGFVDYRQCGHLCSDMTELMVSATEELSSRGEYKELFDLANKAFLKWEKTDKDDSDGETQYFISFIITAWDRVYEADDQVISHAKMYDWFESHLDGSVIDYMEDYLYEYLAHHFREPELLQKKQSFYLKKIEEGDRRKNEIHYEFQASRCREYMLFLMADMNQPIEEIRAYAKGLRSYTLKETMARIEQSYGNTDAVIEIYKELAAEEDARGWTTGNWHLKLKDIYKKTGNEVLYREELVSAMKMNIGNEELWLEYKQGYTSEEWPEACKSFLSGIHAGHYGVYPWLALEGRYDLMMDGLEAIFYSDRLKEYEKELKKRYPERCLALLVADTEQMAENSKKRQDYRRVARNLRWIQKYPGGKEKAAEMAAAYRKAYKQRRAMMEEIAEF